LIEAQKSLQMQIEVTTSRIKEMTEFMNKEIEEYQNKLDMVTGILKDAR
jgi:trehalose/maltose hydrolase-like predicted phosphorylase